MSKYKIPTPAEVDFYQTKEFDAIMERVITAIKQRRFEIIPPSDWKSHINRIKKELSEHWLLESKWSGGRRDGQTIWKLTPKI